MTEIILAGLDHQLLLKSGFSTMRDEKNSLEKSTGSQQNSEQNETYDRAKQIFIRGSKKNNMSELKSKRKYLAKDQTINCFTATAHPVYAKTNKKSQNN